MDRKTYRESLDGRWAEALLAATTEGSDGPLYQRLLAAREHLETIVDEANEALAANPLTETVAKAAAQKSNRKGVCTIKVDALGIVQLEVAANTDGDKNWTSTLPSLDALRKAAKEAGIDPEPFGRGKRALMEAIQEATAKPTPKRRMVKTAPALGQATIVTLPDPNLVDLPL